MKNARLLCGVVLPFALLLSACGGGGGGSKNPPPASSTPTSSTSTSSTPTSSTPVTTKLTIKGGIAADLAGGEVVFTLGSQTLRAPIDSSSRYVAEIEATEQNLNKPLVAIGTGNGSDRWIQLAAVMPSPKKLKELAGVDNVLDDSEYFGVNLTALSTAEYAEMVNNDLPLTSDAERRGAIYSLHPIRAIEQAAMVMQLLTDIETRLPVGVNTTLDYLLDANNAETRLEILRIDNETLLKELVGGIQQDPLQARVSSKRISGEFFLESLYSQYFLTFNDDGSGLLIAEQLTNEIWSDEVDIEIPARFTWLRKGKTVDITFEKPVRHKARYVNTPDTTFACDYGYTVEEESCVITVKSIRLTLISEYDERYIAGLNIPVEAVRETSGEVVFSGDFSFHFARIIGTNKLAAVEPGDLIGPEWVSDRYSYLFSADGKVRQKDLVAQTETTVDWILNGNKISLPNADIWISHLDKAGFSALTIENGSVSRQSFVERMNVSMAESDWIGRWTSYPLNMFSATVDVNADKTWRDGFEGASAGSWSVTNAHTQTAIANASWKMIRDVVAIHEDKYFVSYCQGPNVSSFGVQDCYMTTVKRSSNFDTAVFWRRWSNPAFNEMVSNNPLFTFSGYYLIELDGENGYNASAYAAVSPNKIYKTDKKTIVEMTSASKDEIVLCEYPENGMCSEANKKQYVRGVEVLLSVGEGGTLKRFFEANIDYWGSNITFENLADKIIMLPRDMPDRFLVEPKVGYSIGSVTGCGGALSGNWYEVPGLQENCEISVTFTKN